MFFIIRPFPTKPGKGLHNNPSHNIPYSGIFTPLLSAIYILQPVPPPNLIHPKDVVQCHICFKTYRGLDRRRSLRRHIKSKHDGVKDQVCQFCGQKFGRKYTLDTHVARRHAEQLEALSSHRNSEVDADQ